MADNRTHYEVLGVPETATPDEIKTAFRKLARQWHPDINKAKNAEAMFKEINNAYQTLSDEGKRSRYNLDLSQQRAKQGASRQTTGPTGQSPRPAPGPSAPPHTPPPIVITVDKAGIAFGGPVVKGKKASESIVVTVSGAIGVLNFGIAVPSWAKVDMELLTSAGIFMCRLTVTADSTNLPPDIYAEFVILTAGGVTKSIPMFFLVVETEEMARVIRNASTPPPKRTTPPPKRTTPPPKRTTTPPYTRPSTPPRSTYRPKTVPKYQPPPKRSWTNEHQGWVWTLVILIGLMIYGATGVGEPKKTTPVPFRKVITQVAPTRPIERQATEEARPQPTATKFATKQVGTKTNWPPTDRVHVPKNVLLVGSISQKQLETYCANSVIGSKLYLSRSAGWCWNQQTSAWHVIILADFDAICQTFYSGGSTDPSIAAFQTGTGLLPSLNWHCYKRNP